MDWPTYAFIIFVILMILYFIIDKNSDTIASNSESKKERKKRKNKKKRGKRSKRAKRAKHTKHKKGIKQVPNERIIPVNQDPDVSVETLSIGANNSDTLFERMANKDDQPEYVYIEIGINGRSAGRVIIELFDDVVPKTCENFKCIATGSEGFGYKGTVFHRIIPGFMVQGGDTDHQNGRGGRSIYGGRFPDENFDIRHTGPGLLSMANSGPDTNGSQFFITTDENGTEHLDGKHVVFGRVVDGMDLVYRIEDLGTDDGTPQGEVKIIDCGLTN